MHQDRPSSWVCCGAGTSKCRGVKVATCRNGPLHRSPAPRKCCVRHCGCDMFRVRCQVYCPIEIVLLQGIVYLHSRQIVHADIKPHNILLDEHGQPRISDWGISRVSHGFTRTGDPVSGEGAFTQGYAAPEVVGGSKATFASDMYAAPRARLGTPTSCVLLTHQWRMVQVLVWPCSGARCSQSPQDFRIRRTAKCARAAGTSTLHCTAWVGDV